MVYLAEDCKISMKDIFRRLAFPLACRRYRTELAIFQNLTWNR